MKALTTCLICMFLCLFIAISIGFAQSDEPNLVSPIGAIARSAVAPGWGQFYVNHYFQGSLSLVGISTSFVGALIAHQSFQEIYENEYLPASSINPNSEEANFHYNRANQQFKLRQFFLLAAAGIWAYSIIDAYVGANFHNATAKADLLIEDAKRIENLGIRVGIAPTQLDLRVIKVF